MNKARIFLFRNLIVVLLLLPCVYMHAQRGANFNLPKPIGWVNDYEHLFTVAQQHTLDSIITDYKKTTTVQIAVVSIDTTMVSKENFDTYTLHMANTWGVGVIGKDNGVLIGISKGHRKLRIQNGYGIEKLISDEETKQIVDDVIIPHLKEGNFYEGTLAGVLRVIELLNERMK